MDLQHEVARLRERAAMALAWRLPRWLVYWASVRLGAAATVGRYSETEVPALTMLEALDRWKR